MSRLLVIDDNHSLTHRVAAALCWRGHEVVESDAAEEGRALALDWPHRPDAVMLSCALSRASTPPLLPTLRQSGYTGPILVWHTSRKESDITRCFRRGADQYIPMPFGIGELVARVESSIARSEQRNGVHPPLTALNGSPTQGTPRMYAFGGVEVDLVSRRVQRRGEAVNLSPLEFELLAALLRRDGAPTPRTELLREVWNYGPGVVSRTLDTHILNLRMKLEDEPRAPRHILTVRKVGYRLDV